MTDINDTPVLDQLVPAQAPFSALVRKGQTIRIEDLEGCQAVDTLFYRADDLSERYSSQTRCGRRAPPTSPPARRSCRARAG